MPLKVTGSVFDDLDDDVDPVNANATIHGETAIAVAAPAVVNDTDNETAMDVASADAKKKKRRKTKS